MLAPNSEESTKVIQESLIAGQTAISIALRAPEKLSESDLTPMMFWNQTDGLIFATMQEMRKNKEPIDVITVSEKLLSKTGKVYLNTLTTYCTQVSGAKENYKAYCQVVKEAHRKNRAREIASELINNLNQDSSVENAINALMQLTKEDKNYEYNIKSALKLTIEELDRQSKSGKEMQGISTGITKIDDILGGFHKGDFVIIGGRPGMGKTASLLNMLMKCNVKAGLVSAEQGVKQITQRLIAIKGGVPLAQLRNARIAKDEWEFIRIASQKLMSAPDIEIYDKSAPLMDEVEALGRKWTYEKNIEILFVDYLQRLHCPPGQRKIEIVAENATRCKNLANDLQIPVIALAQVKREVETRNDKRPELSDFSGSSEIENEIDVGITLYRDEYYNPENTQFPNVVEYNIKKNRHGPCGVVNTKWNPSILRISDLNEEKQTNYYQ